MRRVLVAGAMLLVLGLVAALGLLGTGSAGAQDESTTTSTSSSTIVSTTETTEPPTSTTIEPTTTTRRATTTTRRKTTTTRAGTSSTTSTTAPPATAPPATSGQTTTSSTTTPPTTAGFTPPPGRNPRNPNNQVRAPDEGGNRLLPLAVATSLIGLAGALAVLTVQWLRTRRLGRPDLPEFHLPRWLPRMRVRRS